MIESPKRYHPEEYTSQSAPGVYVRDAQPPQNDIDMLWSGNKHKDERSAILFFVGGLLVGIILTAAFFMLFLSKPVTPNNPTQSTLTKPVNVMQPEGEAVPTTKQPPIEIGDPPAAEETTDAPKGNSAEKKSAGDTAKIQTGQTYTIKSGDTLESIAGRFYGNGGPEYVERIQQANNIKDPTSIKPDQQLVIPPKKY